MHGQTSLSTVENNAGTGHEADEVYDHATAVAHLDNDEEFLRELAEMFVLDCPSWLAGIETALAQGDIAAAQRLAHTLKGAAYHFAAPATITAALGLEELAADRDLAGARAAYPELSHAATLLLGRLHQLVHPTTPS
jgi:two-component system, sensor histidine kinase and response regulator